MKIQEAISKIHAPKGMTSVISGIMNNDFSVLPQKEQIENDLLLAEQKVKQFKKAIAECKSDWSYWSILGDLKYWEAIVNIIKAGQLNNGVVADVEAPDLQNCVVMDAISKVTSFGEKVYEQTKKLVK